MDALLPIIVVVSGIIFSLITSLTSEEEDRDVDKDKLDRPKRTRTKTQKTNPGSFFDDIKREFEKAMAEFDFDEETEKTQQKQSNHSPPVTQPHYNSKRTNIDNYNNNKSNNERVRTHTNIKKHDFQEKNTSNQKALQALNNDNNRKLHDKEKGTIQFSKEDLKFDQKAVVNGVIFSEVLGKPKSKMKR